MKYLKLKFDNARLIKEKNIKNLLGSNVFFHPINKMHIYNSVCVLLDRTPTPQLREVNQKFLPLYTDILEVVNNGYIKTFLTDDSEQITTIKKDWNSNLTVAAQYTWKDCSYVTGTLLPVFIWHISEILSKSETKIKKLPFDEVMKEVQNIGVRMDNGEIVYSNEKVNKLIAWCKSNSCTPLSNYIENKQISSRPTGFGKKVNRGNVNANRYSGIIYIPLNDELFNELITYTKGFSTILDSGVVRILGFDEITEDEIIDFKPIKELNSSKKFNKQMNKGIIWSNTIYDKLKPESLISNINTILTEAGISISENQKSYDNLINKILKIKFNEGNLKDIAFKLNNFIEFTINKQYK